MKFSGNWPKDVVHQEQGIGRYRGLQKLTAGGIENDFLVVEYHGNDRLYLPVDRIDQIQRYIGPDGFEPKVDKLGGSSWETVKERVKKSVREVAEELVAIYAAREVMGREAFAAPDRIRFEFCASFSTRRRRTRRRPSRRSMSTWMAANRWIA